MSLVKDIKRFLENSGKAVGIYQGQSLENSSRMKLAKLIKRSTGLKPRKFSAIIAR